MKRIIMSLALTVASATLALADSYNYLTVSAGNIEKSFALRQLKRITFVGEDMVVTNTDGSESSFALDELNRLYFSDSATAISRTGASRPLAYENGQLVANGSGTIQIYNASGALVRNLYTTSPRTSVNLSSLPHGIYIVKQGNKTLKIAK